MSNVRFVTGNRVGYIHVEDRGVESIKFPIPEDLKGIHGNLRWALEKFKNAGCNYYTVAQEQVHGSKQYCYSIYYGYYL